MTIFALHRYGADDPDNDIECLGQWEIDDGDTLSLDCAGAYDGVSLTVKNESMFVEYLDANAVQRVNEVLREMPVLQWVATAYHREGNRMIARVIVVACTRDSAREAGKMMFEAQGYALHLIGPIAVMPLQAGALHGEPAELCPVCKLKLDNIYVAKMGTYWFCPACGPATVPLTLLRNGMIGLPPHILED